MLTSRCRMQVWQISRAVRNLLLMAAVLCGSSMVQTAAAQTHELPEAGAVLNIEAENFTQTSASDYPRAENNTDASGKKNIGYFWWNTWFEIEVEGQNLLDYHVSLRSSCPTGTSVEVQLVHASGEILLATILVPKTGSWSEYTQTIDQTISLPAGVQTLRFKNVGEGANIDYITICAGDSEGVVATELKATNGPDINPLKGFGSGWWRSADDFASVGFQYIEWRSFEPENGKFDWDYVEQNVLNRPGSQGRHLILQFVVDWDDWNAAVPSPDGQPDSSYRGPAWLKKLMGDEFESRGRVVHDGRDRIARATCYNNPIFRKEAKEAIEEILAHFDDDPRGFVVQVGVLGFWGEWHNYPQDKNQADPADDWSPSEATERDVLSTYMSSLGSDLFTQVRFPDAALNLEYAQRGMGYMNGSIVPTEHGKDFGRALNTTEGQLWRNGPVGGEWPPGIDDITMWETFFNGSAGIKMINEARYSTILAPEIDSRHSQAVDIVSKLGASFDQTGQFMTMHRAMGYNFQVKEVRHLVSVDQSAQIHIEVDLHNSGIAPFYKNWDVQLAVLNAATNEVVGYVKTDTDIRTVKEKETTTITGSIDAKFDPGAAYQIGLRILQPNADGMKDTAWKLDARNVYVGLANDVNLTTGAWDPDTHVLTGGWNIIDDVQLRTPEGTFSFGRISRLLAALFGSVNL